MIKLTRPETASDPDALLARLERLERGQVADSKQTPDARRQTLEKTPDARRQTLEKTPDARRQMPDPNDAADSNLEPRTSNLEPSTPAALVSSEPSTSSREPQTSVPVSADRLNEIWPALFGGLRQVLGARRWALFREATPAGIEGNSLILHVAQDFHLEGLQRDAATTALVATHASDLLGQTIGVEFRKSGVVSPPGDDALSRIELDKDRLSEAPADAGDPTALLERELGATFVEEIVAERD
jgi:hypothetical protein